jgi:thymidylate synthase ThyX
MPPDRQVYLLDPRKYTPEVIAVAFAKTSRSPETFQQIADELTDEKSAQFHEKWVVGYGHSSVAEHAVLHIAAENISRLAVECLESNRLASYTEKSTRYQKWDPENFHVPEELKGHALLDVYLDTCRLLFKTYETAMEKVSLLAEEEEPRKEGEPETVHQIRIRARSADVCRFLLPASSLANVGVTINARALEHAVKKMLSHPLAEVRSLGIEIKATAQAEVPTLVKYADADPALLELERLFESDESSSIGSGGDWCRLIRHDKDAEERILAAAFFRHGNLTWIGAQQRVKGFTEAQRDTLLERIFVCRGKRQSLPREVEYSGYTFELILDQGAYFELKRHRMMTQTPQPLGTTLGYTVPRWMSEAGLESEYRRAMETAGRAFSEIQAVFPHVAPYVVPNGYRRRLLLEFNLRSGMHMLALRSSPNAHFSIRRVARRMIEEINQVQPRLGRYFPVDGSETWRSIEKAFFTEA